MRRIISLSISRLLRRVVVRHVLPSQPKPRIQQLCPREVPRFFGGLASRALSRAKPRNWQLKSFSGCALYPALVPTFASEPRNPPGCVRLHYSAPGCRMTSAWRAARLPVRRGDVSLATRRGSDDIKSSVCTFCRRCSLHFIRLRVAQKRGTSF